MPTRILVGYNKPEAGEQAFEHAIELAKSHNASVSVLAVAWPSGAPTALEMAGLMGSETEHFSQAFVDMREIARAHKVPLETKTLVGHPAKQIVQEAQSQGADLIVMANRGQDWIERWLARSISKWVARHAPCTVALVP